MLLIFNIQFYGFEKRFVVLEWVKWVYNLLVNNC